MSTLLFERSGNLLMRLFSAVYEKIDIHMKRKTMWSMYQIKKKIEKSKIKKKSNVFDWITVIY